MKDKPITNLETRISERAKSIFAAFGTIVNDFYLEAGIYFVGGFNAALVAWDIYTTLNADGQPLLYAVIIAIIAFIAVEGLAVYLVGAAAKTNNGLLWFFSVVFAAFFTYAHYQEMAGRGGIISQYITLAIPFFVVVGYWARTVKISAEADTSRADRERDSEAERLRRIEDEDRGRRHLAEDEDRQFNRQLELDKMDKNHQLEMANIEAEKDKIIGQNKALTPESEVNLTIARQSKQIDIKARRQSILSILANEKLTQSDPPPVIIMQSDHGMRGGEYANQNERYLQLFNNFNAYYFPDKGRNIDFETSTSVNSFRVFFNLYFDEQNELLEKKIFRIVTEDNSKQFKDVTNILIKK